MRTTQTLSILFLLFVSLVAPVAVSAQDVTVIIINPRTGGGKTATIPGNDVAAGLRRALGLVSQEEEAQLTHYLTRDEVIAQTTGCLYLDRARTPGFFNTQLTKWNGVLFHAGIFPVLSRFSFAGVTKTVFRDMSDPDQRYKVVYFQTAAFTSNWQETILADAQEAMRVEPEVPEVCPKP